MMEGWFQSRRIIRPTLSIATSFQLLLPAGNLFQHEEANFVAAIKEMTRLRVMRSANNIAMKAFAQDIGILPLHARRHCLPDKRKRLMTIQTAQLDDLAIQRKAMIGKDCLAEANASRVFINHAPGVDEPDMNCIEMGLLNVPKLQAPESSE